MRRRREWAVIALLAAALAVAALLGRATAPDASLLDQRRSSLLAGPAGAKGLADALRRLGVAVVAERRPLAVLDSVPAPGLIALLDLPELLSRTDLQTVRRYVERGGRVFVAGRSRLVTCVGYSTLSVEGDSLAATPPTASWRLPRVYRLLASRPRAEECAGLSPASADTLLRTPGGRPIALRLVYRSGGRVTILADPDLIANHALRQTDAGLVVLPWFLEDGRAGVRFDEYHQGFGEEGSLLGAGLRWTVAAPAGWAMLQLAAAGIVLLALGAVRFGPVAAGVERRRRSSLEHLDALAAALRRAAAGDTAVGLLVAGLRRRLGRAGPAGDRSVRWLGSLGAAARDPRARAAVARLEALVGGRDHPERMVDAANAVEDVWTALGQREIRPRF